jgi:transcription-repair coupling factor (superfamily II helicase)
VPVDELERVWRYGAEGEAVTLDRLKGEAWPKRRAEIEAEIQEAARDLVAAVEARSATAAEKLSPPRRAYERFVARFPFAETPDQARAIEDVLRDLASGRPDGPPRLRRRRLRQDRGGARAAAAAALAGKQVAIVAPTTVLVRQHLNTFRRRFAGTGVVVEQLVAPRQAGRGEARQGRARGRQHRGRDRHPGARRQGRALPRPRARRHRRGAALRDGPETQAPGAGERRAPPDADRNPDPAHPAGRSSASSI